MNFKPQTPDLTIAHHRPYHGVICLGVSPTDIYFNLWSKAEITTGVAGRLVSMEKGANASYKLTKRSNSLYSIDMFNGNLSEFLERYKNG